MADDKKNIGPEAEKPGGTPQEKKLEHVKDTLPPAVESQTEGKAAPAPKVLDFSVVKNEASGKVETALEKKPIKEQAEENEYSGP